MICSMSSPVSRVFLGEKEGITLLLVRAACIWHGNFIETGQVAIRAKELWHL